MNIGDNLSSPATITSPTVQSLKLSCVTFRQSDWLKVTSLANFKSPGEAPNPILGKAHPPLLKQELLGTLPVQASCALARKDLQAERIIKYRRSPKVSYLLHRKKKY